ncbi:hypothetical protein F5B21DRAFT_490842 [Xylaria acuta]|nr:hypothetical protein F5B21DRAFT_490842 [Xylaria acuta]
MRKRRTYKSVFENVDDSDGRSTAKPEDSPACQRLANHSLPTTPRQSANVSPIAPSPQTDCLPSPVTASTSLRSKALDFFLSQSTLWALVVIFTAANGSMVGLGATQSRASECVPDASSLLKNDGFWALLGQLFVSLLSLYCTLVPILRHRARTIAVQQFWFYLMIGLSAAASIAALIVYGYSWQASLVLSNVAGLSALVPAAQLAGGIKGD